MAKRKGSKITRLQRSQNAHVDLNRKWRQKATPLKIEPTEIAMRTV